MVTYTCDSGYEVSTGVTAMATCMASGTWEPLPTCQRMCQLLHALKKNITLHDYDGLKC